TAAEQQRAWHAQPLGDLALELLVKGVVPAHQVRGGGAGALAGSGVLQRGADLELRGQAQVVVAAEAGQPLPIHLQPYPVATGDDASPAQAALPGAKAVTALDAPEDVGAPHASLVFPPGRHCRREPHPAPEADSGSITCACAVAPPSVLVP